MKTITEIKEYLNATDKIIKCDDLKDTIIIYHGDYSVFHLVNAYNENFKKTSSL